MEKSRVIYITIGAGILGAAIFIWFGFYDIAADKKHWKITEWFLEVVRDRSIERKISNIETPSNLDDIQIFVKAAGNYDEMCSQCHLAPGTTTNELAAGLYPTPPDFTESSFNDPARSFWIIKHGIKMTGMPAWGTSHSDEEIWELVAFIQQLPNLDNHSYVELVAKYGGSHQHADSHDDNNMDKHSPKEQGHKNHSH